MTDDNASERIYLETLITGILRLLRTGAFDNRILEPFQEPVFVSVTLKLHDLLQRLSSLEQRIAFTDDVATGDVTDLVSSIRNAIGHTGSGRNVLDKERNNIMVFSVLRGKMANIFSVSEGTAPVGCDYDDDVAIYYGSNRIYLNRHVGRCLNESVEAYGRLYPKEKGRLLTRIRMELSF
jgi:hypothetical protein